MKKKDLDMAVYRKCLKLDSEDARITLAAVLTTLVKRDVIDFEDVDEILSGKGGDIDELRF